MKIDFRLLRVQLVLLFIALAILSSAIFATGMKTAFRSGWRDLARPLVTDYVARIVTDLGNPPDPVKAATLAAQLPLAIKISGPTVNWASDQWPVNEARGDLERAGSNRLNVLNQYSSDGHMISVRSNFSPQDSGRQWFFWITAGLLLLVTALTYFVLRRMLSPIEEIREGVKRFTAADFSTPISFRKSAFGGHSLQPGNELQTLAKDINAMGSEIASMLAAKRSLLLAISHELRSPLTRARLHTELLVADASLESQRSALKADLNHMSHLISDLLESERLTARHAALSKELTDLEKLTHDVVSEFSADAVRLEIIGRFQSVSIDPVRVRLMLRNLVDNAIRHGTGAAEKPAIRLETLGPNRICLSVRDFGPGVPDVQLAELAEPFSRLDQSRDRTTGGVGLGLYLCKMVALAHGGEWRIENANPGLKVVVELVL